MRCQSEPQLNLSTATDSQFFRVLAYSTRDQGVAPELVGPLTALKVVFAGFF